MAKLDGIKVVNENTVEYNGFVYELVTGDAKAADVIKASEQELDVTEGAFYLVVDIDDDNDIVFKDNVDDSNYFSQGEHSVFRKSHAITNDKLTDAEGVVTITLPDGIKLEGTPSDLEKITRSMQKMQNEQQGQVEQGSSEEESEEAVEVENASEPVTKRLQVGDYAKVVEEGSHSAKVGDIVKIFVDDEDNQPFKCEDLQGKELRYPWFYERGLVKATDEEVLEAKQALLKEGDFARVVANTTCHSFEIGTIVKLDDYAEETDAFTAYYIDGSDFWRIYRSDLEPLTKEEVLEAKRALLKEGAFARIIGGENTEDVCGPHNYETGTIVKLACDCDSDGTFETRYLNGDEPDAPWVHRKDLEPLTKEETEHITREAEEEKKAKAEREKWAAIGREVGEIKDGDVVRVIDKDNTRLNVGDIGVVAESYDYVKEREDKQEDSVAFRVNTSNCEYVNWLDVANVELIVPVEQRFDTVG